MLDANVAMRIVEVATSAGLATLAIFLILRRYIVKGLTPDQAQEIERVRAEAALEAREEAMRLREQFEEEAKAQRAAFEKLQANLMERDAQLETRRESLSHRESELKAWSEELHCREKDLNSKSHQLQERLSAISGLDRSSAKEQLLKQLESEFADEAMANAKRIELDATSAAEEKAKQLVLTSMERCAAAYVTEASVSVIRLASEDLKGRIIGREGRNIRAFEQVTGVDLIIDDTPETVTISCFDPVRREAARLALLSLLEDGRIQPATIEDHYEKAKAEVDRQIREAGIDAAERAQVGTLGGAILEAMGRLKFRTSYAQNVLDQSVETAHIAATLASELGFDESKARVAGFLHDVGKAFSSEREGPHALVGMEFLRKQGVKEGVLNAVGAHHREIEPESPEAILVIVADAMSAARPGARRESLDQYMRRLEALEELANSFEGVERSYAVQAGREVRVFVRPETVDDLAASRLASKIARRIEDEMQYPGQVRVTVIRETRSQDIAK